MYVSMCLHLVDVLDCCVYLLRPSLDWFSFWELSMWTRTAPRYISCTSEHTYHPSLLYSPSQQQYVSSLQPPGDSKARQDNHHGASPYLADTVRWGVDQSWGRPQGSHPRRLWQEKQVRKEGARKSYGKEARKSYEKGIRKSYGKGGWDNALHSESYDSRQTSCLPFNIQTRVSLLWCHCEYCDNSSSSLTSSPLTPSHPHPSHPHTLTVWMWPHWLSPRSVTLFSGWRSVLRLSRDSKLPRLRNRPRNSRSSQPPPPVPSTNTETRLSSQPPATTSAQPSLQRQNGVCVPSRLLTSTCVPTTSMCLQTTLRRRGSRTSCPRTSSKSLLSSQIWEHRCVAY